MKTKKVTQYETFAANLRIARRAKNISANDLSKQCEFKAVKRIADFEDHRGVPSMEEVMRVCKELNQKIDDMLFCMATVEITFKDTRP